MKTNILRASLFTPTRTGWGLPILLWGDPGVAKSAILRWLAAEYNMPIEVLSPAARGEGAFGVTPVSDKEGDRMRYPRPDWTDKFVEATRGIVFVDEINLAASHYAGALLGLIQDKVMGSFQFGPGIRIFGAANPVELTTGGWDLSAPAANRIGHLQWPCPDVKTWTDWLLTEADIAPETYIDPVAEEMRVEALWPGAWGKARGVVAGFLTAHQTFLHAMPKNSGNLSKAWTSPRSWEAAARAFASSAVHGLTDVERLDFVQSFIGEGAATEFFTWLAAADLPDSAALLDGNLDKPWKHDRARLDVTMAVFGSAVACVVGTIDVKARARRADALWGLMAQASETAPDLIVPPAKVLVNAKLFAGSVGVLGNLNKVLEAANIRAE